MRPELPARGRAGESPEHTGLMIAAVWCDHDAADLEALVSKVTSTFGPPLLLERVAGHAKAAGMLLAWSGLRDVQRVRGGIALGREHGGDDGEGNFGWVGFRRLDGREDAPGDVRAPIDGIEGERGAMGGEPLYWTHHGRSWVVASRLELLLVLTGRRGGEDLDPAQMAYVLSVQRGASPSALSSTPYEGISRLASSESVELPPRSTVGDAPSRSARARAARSRVLDASPLTGSDDDLAEALWDAVRESVARATEGVRVVGVLAGGGVDSSGLLAAVVAHARERGDLEVVPLAFDYAARGDDRPHRRALEAALHVEAVTVSPEEAGPYLLPSLVIDGQPTLHPQFPLTIAAVHAGKLRGVERILTGFLGDLVLDVPPTAFYDRFRSDGPLGAIGAIAAATLHRDPFAPPGIRRARELLFNPLVRALLPGPLLAARRRRQRRAALPSWAGPVMYRTIERSEPFSARPSTETPSGRFAALEWGVLVTEQIDSRAQVELLTGVRFAEPWMDSSFVQTVARIPGWRLAHGRQDRGLFRHALRGRVPDSVRLRPDKAAIDPALDRMLAAAGGRAAFGDLVRARRLAELGLVDASAWDQCQKRFFARRAHGQIVHDDRDYDADWTAIWNVCGTEAVCATVDGFS